MKIASYWTKNEQGTVQCLLCPKKCFIQEGRVGFCNIRQVINGKLYSLNYGKAAALQIDPIEKKPLFHFLPGTSVFSIGTLGCNFHCKYCQNWHTSQSKAGEYPTEDLSSKEIVKLAIEHGCDSIATTYNDPVIFFEYMLDIAKEAKKHNLKTIMVSNGFICQEPLQELLQYIDAFNIDLKGMTSKFYGFLCGAWKEPVLETLKTIHASDKWLEVTNLVIPTMNDKIEEITALCQWVHDNLSNEVPLHFTGFHPDYQLMHLPSTSKEILIESYKIAKKIGLKYVYVGNLKAGDMENTHCPGCKKLLIERDGYTILNYYIKNGKCPECNANINGVFDETKKIKNTLIKSVFSY